jgi:hypothetical protein
MEVARRNHTATLLPNATVLVAGGYNGTYVNAPEIYHPATGVFAPTGDMSVARRYPTATLLPDGGVLLAGGGENGTDALASAEISDTATGLFGGTGSMGEARARQTATLLGDGTVLIAGGYNLQTPLASAELYDPAGGLFSPSATFSTAEGPVEFIRKTVRASSPVIEPRSGQEEAQT